MHRREPTLGQRRVRTVDKPEQRHRGPADEIDVGMEVGLVEALVDADPNAEAKPKLA